MNPEVKKKWVKALRSGEYSQTRERLTDGENYCCLGVLCDIGAKEGLGEWILDEGGTFWFEPEDGRNPNDTLDTDPPPLILEWAGFDKPMTITLIRMNDELGSTFTGIADFIEDKM